jgi:hypothetical protein
MKDLFVPYEQSLQLKELGFDEPCFGNWLSSFQSGWKVYELILELGMNEEFEDNRNVYLLDGACSAPTFSQAFRWFREKYDLVSWIRRRPGFVKEYSWYISDWNDEDPDEYYYDLHIETYAQAELALIDKLIELTKNKQ